MKSAIGILILYFTLGASQPATREVHAGTLGAGAIVVGVSSDSRTAPNFNTRLVAVDPITGMTTTVSDNATGTGPSLSFGSDGSYISYITQQNDGSLLVVDDSSLNPLGSPGSYESRLYRVEPSTGNRSLISDVSGTAAVDIVNAARQVGSTIFATTNAGLETIDPTTGVVTPFATTGVAIQSPLYGLVPQGNQFFVAGRTDIYKIDSTTGAASIASGPGLGGSSIGPADLTFDALGHLYAAGINGTAGGIYGIDLTTGQSTPLSTSTSTGTPVGSGPPFSALTIGAAPFGSIYAININGGLLSIDPVTGNRVLLSQVESAPLSAVVSRGLAVLANVPEPSSMILAAFGAFALCLRRALSRPAARSL